MKRWPLCVGAVSAAALGFEVQLLRILGLQHWHQFAALIIGLALLGYALAGTLLALVEARGRRVEPEWVFVATLVLGPTLGLSLALAQQLPFNGLELVWDPRQLIWLGGLMVLLSLPFVAAGWAILCAFRLGAGAIGRIYAGDLIGGGLGAGLSAILFTQLPPSPAIGLCAGFSLLAAAAVPGRIQHRPAAWVVAASMVGLLAVAGLPALKVSPFKGLSAARATSGAEELHSRYGLRGHLAVVDNAHIPSRFAPGLSVQGGVIPPAQLALFQDGDRLLPVHAGEHSDYLRHTLSAAVYSVLNRPTLLIAGSGTGVEIHRALAHGARRIIAAEPDADLVDLLQNDLASRSGRPYSAPGVEWENADPRRVLGRVADLDLVVMASSDSLAGMSAGVGSLRADGSLTSQAWSAALDALGPRGWVTWTGWVQLPPRRALKQVAALNVALRQRGVEQPEHHLVVLRDWGTVAVLVSVSTIRAEQVENLRSFARSRGFDLVYLPGLERSEANQRFAWPQPLLHDAVQALLGEGRAEFLAAYPFDLSAPTDDRPYPGHTFRRGLLEHLGQSRASVVLLESGYVVQAGIVMMALLAGLGLLALPLVIEPSSARGLGGIPVYVLCIGLGFLLLEVALIERAALWIGHPQQAFALVIAAMLAGAGVASAWGRRVVDRWGRQTVLSAALAGLAVVLFILVVLGSGLDAAMLSLAVPAAMWGTGLIAGLCGMGLGVWFPLALEHLSCHRPGSLPWAWALNGVASVVGSGASLLIAADGGLRLLSVCGGTCYMIAWMAARRWPDRGG